MPSASVMMRVIGGGAAGAAGALGGGDFSRLACGRDDDGRTWLAGGR
jgi:hypothetical protein